MPKKLRVRTSKEPTNLAWALYACSIPIALVAVALLAPIVMRFYRFGEIPLSLWSDEAFSGLEILRVLREPEYRLVAGAGQVQGLPALAWYLSAPFVTLSGPTEIAQRIPAAAARVAGVVVLGHSLLGMLHGLIVAGILATMAWYITFSRISMHGINWTE